MATEAGCRWGGRFDLLRNFGEPINVLLYVGVIGSPEPKRSGWLAKNFGEPSGGIVRFLCEMSFSSCQESVHLKIEESDLS